MTWEMKEHQAQSSQSKKEAIGAHLLQIISLLCTPKFYKYMALTPQDSAELS